MNLHEPEWVECFYCDGSGEAEAFGSLGECAECDGMGGFGVPPELREYERAMGFCDTCRGTGRRA